MCLPEKGMKGLCPASETLNNYVQRWENSSLSKDILFWAVLHQITLTLKSFSYSIEETGSRSLQVKHGGVGTRLISSGAGSLATLRIKMSFFLCGVCILRKVKHTNRHRPKN